MAKKPATSNDIDNNENVDKSPLHETKAPNPSFFGDDDFEMTDGGEIPPGWAPQLNPKWDYETQTVRDERIASGKIESMAVSVIGTLATGIAWNDSRYVLLNATDSDGKVFPVLRLPDSKPLWRSLGFKKMGAPCKIVYKGKVKVEKGYAHTFDIYVKNPAENQLAKPRPDALVLLTEDQKKHLEKIAEMTEKLDELARQNEIENIRKQAKLLTESNTVDAEFDELDAADEFARRADAAFGKVKH